MPSLRRAPAPAAQACWRAASRALCQQPSRQEADVDASRLEWVSPWCRLPVSGVVAVAANCPHSERGLSLGSAVESVRRGGLGGRRSPTSMRSAVASAQEISPLTSMPWGGAVLHGLIRSAARRSSLAAPTVLPRWAWVMPTANWARPRHRSRSADGAAFHVPSRTSCAWNARPLSSSLCASANDSSGGSARSSGGRSTPSAPLASGRPSSSRGRAFRARPATSRSRSTAMLEHLEWRHVRGESTRTTDEGNSPSKPADVKGTFTPTYRVKVPFMRSERAAGRTRGASLMRGAGGSPTGGAWTRWGPSRRGES
jgi:hypothetical protein